MSDTIESDITDIRMAYRLMLHSKITQARQKGDKVAEKAASSELEKDDVLISDAGKSAQSTAGGVVDNNVDIRLVDLFQKIYGPKEQPEPSPQAQVIEFFEKIETEATLTYSNLERVDGLIVKNRNLAETDRYRFEFINGSTFKITDKWSNKSTTIWGDPHVDTSDQPGDMNGDFKDLTGSNKHTTFMLFDNTRITFTAFDNGIIEQVDIFHGSQHLSGVGAGAKSWNEENGLFARSVTHNAYSALSSVPVGDAVYAGGDGNDWFDAAKNLIWGQTSGPIVTSRPSSVLEFTYNQRIIQQVSVMQVNQQV